MRKIELVIVIVILALCAILFAGCQEQQRRVWGRGDPPAEWQQFFGNDNIARINFMQTQTLNKQGQALTELAERLRVLEAENPAELAERVRKLEEATVSIDYEPEEVTNVWRKEDDSGWEYCYIARADGTLKRHQRYVGKIPEEKLYWDIDFDPNRGAIAK